jgi:hypothetical protein
MIKAAAYSSPKKINSTAVCLFLTTGGKHSINRPLRGLLNPVPPWFNKQRHPLKKSRNNKKSL